MRILGHWKALAIAVTFAGSAAAQVDDQPLIEAFTALGAACSQSADECAAVLPGAMYAVASSPRPAEERIYLTLEAVNRALDAALPRNATDDTVGDFVTLASALAVDNVKDIIGSAPSEQLDIANAAVPIIMEGLVDAATLRVATHPRAAAQIGIALVLDLARAPMSAPLRVLAMNSAAARVTRAVPAAASSSVVSAVFYTVAGYASELTKGILDDAPESERAAIARAAEFGRREVAAAAAEQSRARPEIAEQMAILAEFIGLPAPASQAPSAVSVPALTPAEASPT